MAGRTRTPADSSDAAVIRQVCRLRGCRCGAPPVASSAIAAGRAHYRLSDDLEVRHHSHVLMFKFVAVQQVDAPVLVEAD